MLPVRPIRFRCPSPRPAVCRGSKSVWPGAVRVETLVCAEGARDQMSGDNGEMPPRPARAGAEGEGGGRDGRQAGGSGRGGAHRWGMARAEGREAGRAAGGRKSASCARTLESEICFAVTLLRYTPCAYRVIHLLRLLRRRGEHAPCLAATCVPSSRTRCRPSRFNSFSPPGALPRRPTLSLHSHLMRLDPHGDSTNGDPPATTIRV